MMGKYFGTVNDYLKCEDCKFHVQKGVTDATPISLWST